MHHRPLAVIGCTMNLKGSLLDGSQDAKRNLHSETSSRLENDCSYKSEVINPTGDNGDLATCTINSSNKSCRFQLEQDVQRLQRLLHEEMELHVVLENAVEHASVKLSDLSCLPNDAHELLFNIATLEITVSRLEEEMVSLHFQIIQERNERKLAEYHLKQLPSEPLLLCSPDNVRTPFSSCSRRLASSTSNIPEVSCTKQANTPSELTSSISGPYLTSKDTIDSMPIQEEKVSQEVFQHVAFERVQKQISVRGLWNHPNLLSEEIVRCMKNIFISLADSSIVSSKYSSSESLPQSTSPHGHISSYWSLSELSTISSWVWSPQVDLQCDNELLATGNAFDPYKVRGKLSWTDIGTYSSAIEVSWMSVGKKQLEYASGALRRFRSLVEQLAEVNPTHLSGNEKLAFWINLYNALIMHAYLAYGVPKSDMKLFSLMQKAAYIVGGQSFSAACIEYVILKMKPPVHRPQIALLLALHKLKVSEEQKRFSIETCEPLAAFALSCGTYSSPAVRIYTPRQIREDLQEAQRDFIRASVGLSSKGKLMIPKMLHCFARGSVDDANLAIWTSRFLPQQQAAFVEQCLSQRRHSFLGSRSCGVLPFDSRFRYLFLPEILP